MGKWLVLFFSIISVFLVECSSKTNMTGSGATVTDLDDSWVEKEQIPPLSLKTVNKLEPVDASPVKIDLLLVRDNSGSMESEQSGNGLNAVIEDIGYLLDKLSMYEDIDYRIAITTTTSQAVIPHHKENGTWKYAEKWNDLKATQPINPNNSACLVSLYENGNSSVNKEKKKFYYSLEDYKKNKNQMIEDLKKSLSQQNIEAQDGSVFAVEEGLMSTLEALNLVKKDVANKVWNNYPDYKTKLNERPYNKITPENKDTVFMSSFDTEDLCERTQDWYRPEAKLVIIFFSDEDHCSFNTQIASAGDGIEGKYAFGCLPYNYVEGDGYGLYWKRTGYTYSTNGAGTLLSVFGLSSYESDGVEHFTLNYKHHTKNPTALRVGYGSSNPSNDTVQWTDQSISKLNRSDLLADDDKLKEVFYNAATEYEQNCHNMGKDMYYINYTGGAHTLDPIKTKDIIPGLQKYIGKRNDISVEDNNSDYYGCPKCNEDNTSCTVPENQRITSVADYKQKYDRTNSYINMVPPKERCIAGESHPTDIRLGKAMCTYVKARYKNASENEKWYYRNPRPGQLTSYDIGMTGREDSRDVFLEYLKTLEGKNDSLDNIRIYGALNLNRDEFNSSVVVSNTYKEVVEKTGGEVVSIWDDHSKIYDKIYENLSKAFIEDKSSGAITEKVSSVELGKMDSSGNFVKIQQVDPAYYKVSASVIKFSRFKMDPNATHMRISYVVAE